MTEDKDESYGFFRPGDIVRVAEKSPRGKQLSVGLIGHVMWRPDIGEYVYQLEGMEQISFLGGDLEHTDERKKGMRAAELINKNTTLRWRLDVQITLLAFIVMFLVGRLSASCTVR